MDRWHLGLLLLGVVVFLWVASGYMVNAMVGEYEKPYFITYLNTGSFVVYLIPSLISRRSARARQEYSPITDNPKAPLSARATVVLGCKFSLLWFLSNLFTNAAYMHTTVASATIIACTSSFFTLLTGVAVGVEKFSMAKLVALVVSFAGVILITVEDKKDLTGPSSTLTGNIYALISAALYGIYTTLLKHQVGDESRFDSKLFFGAVGSFSLVVFWPLLILFSFLGIEQFAVPQNKFIWAMLILNIAATVVSDLAWALAMLMTSPLVVTVGLSATIPLSMLGDMIILQHFGSLMYYFGAAMVCWSFFVINRQEQEEHADD